MAGKRQEQDKQQAAASVETPAQAGQSLPTPPKPLDDPAMVDRGFQAREFQRSPEAEYFNGIIDRMIEIRKWEKLNLCRGQGEQLDVLNIEIELLEQIKSTPQREVNMGNAAQEREDHRNR